MTGRWASSNRRSELPPDWHRIRARILHRDGHQCTWISDAGPCGLQATDVDHIGDRHDHSDLNLRALCHPHHEEKTQAEAQAARAARSRRRPPPSHPGLVGGGGGPP